MSNQSTELTVLLEISKKLDDLITLFAVQGKERDDQIKIMVSKGYSNSQISVLLGIPKGTVDSIRAKQSKQNR